MRSTLVVAGALLLASAAGAWPDEKPAPPLKERPAEVTQVWPPHKNGAALPATDVKDTDPNAPRGGGLWRWQVAAPRRGAGPGDGGAALPRVCRIEVVPTRSGVGGWIDDEALHLAGELTAAQQTWDGRDFWESDASLGAWWTSGCARALPESGFTFQASVTQKELAKARIQRVRFRLGSDGARPPTAGTAAEHASIDVWTDVLGAPRSVPLTAPVTPVGLAPRLDGTHSACAAVGLRGIMIVRGARALIEVRDLAASGRPFSVYASLERDMDGDDPSPSGLRATRAPLPASPHVRIQAATAALDAAGSGSFTVATPDEHAAVGLTFYVQAGVGPEAALGLSCALRCTIVASLADYDGDGRPNEADGSPLDPEL